MTRRTIAGAGAAAIGAATAVTALVLGTASGHAQDGESSATGLQIHALDLVLSEAASDGTQSDALIDLAELDLPVPIDLKVLDVSAVGSAAHATLTHLNIDDEIIADLVKAECSGATGTTTIAGLQIPSGDFAESYQPDPNTTIIPEELEEIAQITLNRQTTNPDGSLTVEGIVIDLVGDEQIVISSATCTPGDSDNGNGDNGDNGDGDNGDGDNGDGDAPKPAPITTGLPVTG